MSNIIYSEKAPQVLWTNALLLVGVFAILFSFIQLLNEDDPTRWTLLGALILISWAYLAFQNIHFEITETAVTAWFWPFHTTMEFKDITKVEVTKLPWYVGIGLRLWGNRIAYTTRFGSAVQMTKEKGYFKIVILTTQHPETFARMVKERLKRRK